MAKERFRTALNAASFPFCAALMGRTVVNPRMDVNVRTPQSFYGSAESAEVNTPQLIYCENVMPTGEGLMSVLPVKIIEALSSSVTDFDQAITLRDQDENNFLYVPARGKNYVWDASDGLWKSVNPFTGWNGKLVTRAYVNGRTFICFEKQGIYEYDHNAGTFLPQTITGLSAANIRGIGSSNNYLIAFEDLTVNWSSLVNPLDFTPSLTTGAGNSIPQDVKARITAVLGISGGFIIYTAKNAIAAVYTNNVRAPFTFKEIANAGGIQTYEQVTSEQTSGAQYAWTTGGFQKITVQNAESVSAEVNDFIAGNMWDEYDSATGALNLFYSSTKEFPVKLSFISSRYVVLSYSTNADSTLYQWAIILDTVLKRWGKVRLVHTDCFSYPYPNVSGEVLYSDLMNTDYDDLTSTTYYDLNFGVISDPPSKQTIAFLQPDGTVYILKMDYNKTEEEAGVVVLGKFQMVRAAVMGMQQIDIEGEYGPGANPAHPMTVRVSNAIDGYNARSIVPAKKIYEQGKMGRWARRLTGMNLDVRVEGTFALSTVVIEATNEGDR